MVFSSLLFLFRFLPIILLCYFVAPKKFRNFILFIASLVFYAWGEPVYVILLLASSVLDYTMGRLIECFRDKGQEGKTKLCLICSLLVNLSLLGFFKYTDFVIRTINAVAKTDIGLLELALPIGISFYTFQTLSYTIDVYRKKVPAQHNFITFAAYVALFPQLIAGPIVRYQTIAEELNGRTENWDDFSSGVTRFVIGLGKKVLIANSVGAVFRQISGMQGAELSMLTAWMGVVAYTFQIYFDFSGYSDMAIGLGRMFGFHFLENFEHPYESKSVTEFWRRWHISLGTWFKEYVYIPLGGNRSGFAKQIRNIAVVWLLTGLWHGASWNFVLWGVYYGILLVIEKLFFYKVLEKIPAVFAHIYTIICFVIGWGLFCYSDIADGPAYVQALLGHGTRGFMDQQFIYLLCSNLVMFIIAIIGSTSIPQRVAEKVVGRGIAGEFIKNVFLIACMFLVVTFLVSDSYNPFLYFRF